LASDIAGGGGFPNPNYVILAAAIGPPWVAGGLAAFRDLGRRIAVLASIPALSFEDDDNLRRFHFWRPDGAC